MPSRPLKATVFALLYNCNFGDLGCALLGKGRWPSQFQSPAVIIGGEIHPLRCFFGYPIVGIFRRAPPPRYFRAPATIHLPRSLATRAASSLSTHN
jgi:hypothetical protein